MTSTKLLLFISIIVILIDLIICNNNNLEQNIITDNSINRYAIEGKVIPFSELSQSLIHFMTNTKIIVNYGQYLAFLKYNLIEN
jgi:hypothetical protein